MAYIDFMSQVHKNTKRDYLGRVNDPDYPKAKAAELAKKWGHDYWDGDRKINYGGYYYREGYWDGVARMMVERYGLKSGDKILDIGCGKGFLLFDLKKIVPGIEIYGIDVSAYAIAHAKDEVKDRLQVADATLLPFPDHHFDFVFSLNTFHNLHCYDLDKALRQMERVGKDKKYVCVESYRTEVEKANLLYWQVTCEMFCTPAEWEWWFHQTGYSGDHSFIYFE